MTDRNGRVLPATRALSITIIPFLVVAFVVLFVYPYDTRRLFAWPISPRMTPMVLGSVYLGGAYFFLRAARADEWHQVKAGFVPVGTVASLMAIATVIHWNRFTHDHPAFWPWAGLYFTTPLLGVMLSLIFVSGVRARADLDLSRPLTLTLILGMGLTLAGGALFYASMRRREPACRRLSEFSNQDTELPPPGHGPV